MISPGQAKWYDGGVQGAPVRSTVALAGTESVVEVNVGTCTRSLKDGTWFLMAIITVEAVQHLRTTGVIVGWVVALLSVTANSSRIGAWSRNAAASWPQARGDGTGRYSAAPCSLQGSSNLPASEDCAPRSNRYSKMFAMRNQAARIFSANTDI